MLGGSQFVGVDDHHIVADDIVRQVVGIVNAYVISQVATDDRDVIETDGPAQIVEFQVVGIQPADAYQAKEFTVLYQFRGEGVRYEDMVPVGGGIAVSHQHFYFISCQPAIGDPVPVLQVP